MTEGRNCLIISLPFQFKITTATFATLLVYILISSDYPADQCCPFGIPALQTYVDYSVVKRCCVFALYLYLDIIVCKTVDKTWGVAMLKQDGACCPDVSVVECVGESVTQFKYAL